MTRKTALLFLGYHGIIGCQFGMVTKLQQTFPFNMDLQEG